MKTLALLTALTLATFAPAHANPVSDAAIQMCDGFTQVVMLYVDTGMTREDTDRLVNSAITAPELRNILMEMLDIADDSPSDVDLLDVEVRTYCISEAIGMIMAVQ